MRAAIHLLAAAVVLLGAGPARAEPPPAAREGADHAVPLYGALVRPYDAPDDPYAPGHRGIDVGAAAGAAVHASAPGTVSFAGSVAGNRTVTVDHGGGLLSTYSFLATISVARGASVARGTPLGTLGAGHPGSGAPPHVHLSMRRDGVYLDPAAAYLGHSHADLISLVG